MRGPSRHIDPRTNAFRDDLADIALADCVIAARYAESLPRRCTAPTTMLHAAPAIDAVATSALLHGEIFDVFDVSDGWAWGACAHDRYVGYVDARALDAAGMPPTHRVSAPAALVFSSPDIKSRVINALPCNARVTAGDHDACFVAATGGYIHRAHLGPPDGAALSPAALVNVARGFLGSPYLWGGRTRDGIDCSGLTQAALIAVGVTAPRDSDQQAANVGVSVDFASRRAGDLLFFPGHVGLIADNDQLLHANAHWMATVIEPLDAVLQRLRSNSPDAVPSVRRP